MPDTSPTDSAGEPYLPQLLLKGQLDPKTVDMSLHSGQSSAPSSFSASSIRDSLSSMSTAPTSQSHHTPMSTVAEGSARSGPQEGESKSRGLGERARGLMGGRFGSIRGQPRTCQQMPGCQSRAGSMLISSCRTSPSSTTSDSCAIWTE